MVKVLLIEDEQPAAQRLEKMLTELAPDFNIISRCDSIESSVHYLSTHSIPDLIFLDIQLGDGLSFDIFNQIYIPCPIIFTTAYDEYAIRAFEQNSIDYILKPINKDHLQRSIDKFKRIGKFGQTPDISSLLEQMNSEQKSFKQRFMVYVGEHLYSIPTTEIAYFYSVEKSTYLATYAGKNYPLEYSLDKVEDLLSPMDYFRINRNYIVSFQSIEKINILSKSRIKITINPQTSDDTLVSAARTPEFRKWLDR
jgi:DNA-binding LytR/AlgR family response regulator